MRSPRLAFTALAFSLLLLPLPALAADPTTADCLAANNSSIDLRNDHKLRAARAQLLICAAANCPNDIRKECLRKVDEVNGEIPTITFEAKDPTGKDLSAVKVTLDGQPLVSQLEGTALSVDPGEHTFVFETEGQAPVTKQLVVIEAQKDRRETIIFGTPAVAPVPSVPTTATVLSPPVPPPASEVNPGLGTQKILALAAGGVGVVGLGVGSVFGIVAMSQKSDAQNACPNLCATKDGVNKWNDAASSANVSTALFIVGGVGIAAGAVLWLTAKPSSPSSSSTQVGVGPGTLELKGTW